MCTKLPKSFPDAADGHSNLFGRFLEREPVNVVEHCDRPCAFRFSSEEAIQEVRSERLLLGPLIAGDRLKDLVILGLRPALCLANPVETNVGSDGVEKTGRG